SSMARLMRLDMAWSSCTASGAGDFDKGPKYPPIGLADLKFGMPLDAETETVMGIFDPLHDAVFGHRVDDEPGPCSLDRLVVRSVDTETVHSGDPVEKGTGNHLHAMPGLVARVVLTVRDATRNFVRDMLDQRAAKRHIQ